VSNGYAERAEFIRVQVELARTACSAPRLDEETEPRTPRSFYCNSTDCRHTQLGIRERELFEAHKCRWFGDREDAFALALYLPWRF
jgi:hypothetical protein